MVPDAPYHYACDSRWWDKYYDKVKQGFKGKSYTINCIESPERNPDKKYNLERVNSKFGANIGDDCLHYGVSGGTNSGHQAINLAYLLGAKTIILLGFDMQGDHYFGKHPKGLDVQSPFADFRKSLSTINKPDLDIINCTRKTALTCFPIGNLESVLSSVQGQV